MTKRLLLIGAAVMCTLSALLLLWQFRQAIVYVVISLALAAAVRPLIQRLNGRRLVVRIPLILLYLLVLVGAIFLLIVSSGAAVRDLQQLAQQLSVQDAWRQPAWLRGFSLQQFLDTRLPPPSALVTAMIGEEGEFVLPAAWGLTQGIFNLFSGGLIVFFLSLYWSIDQVHFERLWLSLLPPSQRSPTRDIWQTVESDLGAYIRSEGMKTILAGLLLGGGYWLLGSPYPALLAISGAIALLVPVVGVLLALILPLLLGLLSGTWLSGLTVLYTVSVVVGLKRWVVPHLAHRRPYNPMVSLLILMAMANLYGLMGIIVAPPLSAAVQILWSRLINNTAQTEKAVQISDLKERQARVEELVREMSEPSPLISSSMARLSALLEKAEPTR